LALANLSNVAFGLRRSFESAARSGPTELVDKGEMQLLGYREGPMI